jgi:transcriptional regulator with XRE-family HTH domain
VATPTRAKKRLGAFLRRLRDRSGMKAADGGQALKKSAGTVRRYEAGDVAVPGWGDLQTLMVLYGAKPAEFNEGARLWRAVDNEPRSVRLPAGAPPEYHELVTAEQRAAVRERELAPSVIPGLLQTKGYAQALIEAGHRLHKPKSRRASVVEARMKRQECLTRPDPLVLHALIDEAAIRRQVGGPDVSREQLAHLVVAAEKPHVTVQVIPFGVGAYGTMNGSCIILDYPDAAAIPEVYLEYPAGGDWVDNVEDVKRFTTMFDDVSELALSPADTTDLILHQIRALKTR